MKPDHYMRVGMRNFLGLCFIDPRNALEVLAEVVDPAVVEEAMGEYCSDCLPQERIMVALEQMMTDYLLNPVLALSADTAGPP